MKKISSHTYLNCNPVTRNKKSPKILDTSDQFEDGSIIIEIQQKIERDAAAHDYFKLLWD